MMFSKLGGRVNARRMAVVAALAGVFVSTAAFAADPYTGTIGRIDTRSGHADTTVYRNAIVIRGSDQGVVCVLDANTELATQFLSQATAAMLSGATVTLDRGGALNGQFKCYQIAVRK
jgi:hypothetical protein